jgi:hypothetical protein
MTIKIKDIIKVLSIVSAIVSGIGEVAKQINSYRDKEAKKEIPEVEEKK